jgi:AcrR family transcriptional regulator
MSRTPRRRSRSTPTSAPESVQRTATAGASTEAAGPASSIKLSYAEKVRALLRDSLIDAAAEALTRNSWAATRMADIAAAVGVSRQTVYNEFGTKDELGRALLLRESGRFLGEVEAAQDGHPNDPVGGLVAALEVFLRRTQQEPLLRAIIGGADAEHPDLGPILTGQGGAVLPFITERLTERFLTDWPDAEPANVRCYADAVVRLAISHVVFPVAEPHRTATEIARVMAPYLAQLTA